MTSDDTLILIGEDEPDNQLIMQTVVESLVGARAEVASDGLAVLASVEREQTLRARRARGAHQFVSDRAVADTEAQPR